MPAMIVAPTVDRLSLTILLPAINQAIFFAEPHRALPRARNIACFRSNAYFGDTLAHRNKAVAAN